MDSPALFSPSSSTAPPPSWRGTRTTGDEAAGVGHQSDPIPGTWGASDHNARGRSAGHRMSAADVQRHCSLVEAQVQPMCIAHARGHLGVDAFAPKTRRIAPWGDIVHGQNRPSELRELAGNKAWQGIAALGEPDVIVSLQILEGGIEIYCSYRPGRLGTSEECGLTIRRMLQYRVDRRKIPVQPALGLDLVGDPQRAGGNGAQEEVQREEALYGSTQDDGEAQCRPCGRKVHIGQIVGIEAGREPVSM